VIAVLLTALISGCGGGGGSNGITNANDLPDTSQLVKGTAYLHPSMTNPMIACLRVDMVKEMEQVGDATPISRPSVGWQDVDFAFSAPTTPSEYTVYTIAVFNDLDHNGKYIPGMIGTEDGSKELIGYANGLLVWQPKTSQWQIHDLDTTEVRWLDAFAQGGRKNLYVDGEELHHL